MIFALRSLELILQERCPGKEDQGKFYEVTLILGFVASCFKISDGDDEANLFLKGSYK